MPSPTAEPLRYVALAAIVLSALGCAVFFLAGRVRAWWGRRNDGVYPGSSAHQAALKSVEDGTASNLAAWRSLSTAEQAASDEAAIEAGAKAEKAARLEVERAKVNVLFHP